MIEHLHPSGIGALFLIGLLGAGHCVGMCGGIATGLGLATRTAKGGLFVVAYNLGRIVSYSCAGLLVAALGYWGSEYLLLAPWLRGLAGLLLILMGLYLADWWKGLLAVEQVGARLWRYIQPLGKYLLPVTNIKQALLLGMLWGWLPCGLIYSALAYAATAPNPVTGAAMMAAFGLGTAPAMLLGGWFSDHVRRLLQRLWLRRMMALILISFGVWTLYQSFMMNTVSPHHDIHQNSHLVP